ncbi:radical SAM protein [Aliivibrio fischeri]|uniref:radical SAM protein n=1 Tax=Aliivibrio fischeri TaxID=668 RepID=UPI001433415F|nr:radical SAM protein [Aliivibrio fischeri]
MKKIYLAHNTCLNSSYDLNVLQAGLIQKGNEIVSSPEDADEIIYSGCSVRSRWVDDAINQINEAANRSPNAKIHVTGCLANTSAAIVRTNTTSSNIHFETIPEILNQYTNLDFSKVDQSFTQDSSVKFEHNNVHGLQNLRQRVGEDKASIVASLQEIDRLYGKNTEHYYRSITKGFVFYEEQKSSEMITVTRSCPYKCAFCSIPQGRGSFESVPLFSIVEKARKAVERGKFHIILIGDEIGNYHAPDCKANFKKLVESLLLLSPKVKLSIRYIEPKPFLKFFNSLLKWSKEGRIQLLYISIQSGSERILKIMNRGYDLSRLSNALKELRESSPVVLYGNWLIGFPGENDDDFLQTVSLVKDLEFQINVVIPFSARENTPAFDMPNQLDERTINDRVNLLTEIVANMKALNMEGLLNFLDKGNLTLLVDRIRNAECLQYIDDQQESEPSRTSSLSIEVKQL